jgi:hypothetical protein
MNANVLSLINFRVSWRMAVDTRCNGIMTSML